MPEITVAIAGNPNCGKTTIFNALTGARQHVGNYPGVTVEKKEGVIDHSGVTLRLVDLPGTYSLSANSPEEVVARDFLVKERPDVVVHVVDANNLDRNLYLTTQLMELGLRLVLALNMVDVAEKRGLTFDRAHFERHLKAPVVSTVGNRSRGLDDLLSAVVAAAGAPVPKFDAIPPPADFARLAGEIDAALAGPDRLLADGYPKNWLAARLLEGDPEVTARLDDHSLLVRIGEIRADFERRSGASPEIRLAETKFGWAAGLAAEVTRLGPGARADVSDKVDAVMLNRWLGLPIFLSLMYALFQLVFTFAEPPMEWIESAFGLLAETIAGLWPGGAESPLRDLLVEGVIGGVGGVLVFLPNILLLFLAIAFLEGTGYMARAAFIMDRYMHRIGLHGKSFIPMLLGFGCTVPAIMAARTLENRRDRLTTIMVLPFMSCGARLPIYTLLIPAFFPDALRAWMLWTVYVIGVLFAVAGARLLRATVFAGESESFVMELPPYRMPTLRTVLLLMWDKAGEYCKKAGTVILSVSVILWAMTTYPKKEVLDRDYDAERAEARAELTAAGDGVEADGADDALLSRLEEINNAQAAEELAYSLSGRVGAALEPVLAPLGFDWRIGTAIIGSFAAKEVFVAQMGIVYSVGEADGESSSLRDRLRAVYSPLQAFCMMLYCLLSMPCVATVAVVRREAGGWKYALAMAGALTAVAYVTTLVVFQAGTALGIGI